MKKLGYIVATFPKASETFVYREVMNLHDLGIDLKVFACSPPSADDQKTFTPELLNIIVTTFYLGQNESFKSLLRNPLMALKIAPEAKQISKEATNNHNLYLLVVRAVLLAEQLKRNKIEHLHAHWPYSTIIGYLAARLLNISFSVSIHAHEVAHENGHFKRIFPKLSFASFCNQAAMEYLLQNVNGNEAAKRRSHLIYHGVNIEKFPYIPLTPPAEGEPYRLFSAGRLTNTKGFDRLIKACANARNNGFEIELTILGKGPEEENIKRAAAEYGFTNHLTMPGWVAHDEVQQYIERSHFFALLADVSFHDGLPNVVLESMASGRPVIISPLPAAEEAVSPQTDGFILNAVDDYDGFVEVFKFIEKQPLILRQMSKAARTKIETVHADKIHIKRMVELFEKV